MLTLSLGFLGESRVSLVHLGFLPPHFFCSAVCVRSYIPCNAAAIKLGMRRRKKEGVSIFPPPPTNIHSLCKRVHTIHLPFLTGSQQIKEKTGREGVEKQ